MFTSALAETKKVPDASGKDGLSELADKAMIHPTGSEESMPFVGLPSVPLATGIIKILLKAPILVWRVGLGPLAGHKLMIMTTTGRKSGLPRRTPVGFDEYAGRKYVVTLRGPNTDWYRNILADPRVTIQSRRGTEHVRARRVTGDREIGEAFECLARLPVMRDWAARTGVVLSREEVIAHKESFILITFDPTDEMTPPPLDPDLWWLWPLAEAFALLVWLIIRFGRKRAGGPRGRASRRD